MLNLTIEEIHGYEEHGVDKLGNRVIKVSSVPVTLVHADLIVLGQNLQIGPATIRGLHPPRRAKAGRAVDRRSRSRRGGWDLPTAALIRLAVALVLALVSPAFCWSRFAWRAVPIWRRSRCC